MNKPPKQRNKTTSAPKSNTKSSLDAKDEDNPANATITVAAAEVPELTEDELRDRLHLERKVERAFFEAGKALKELRDRRLYRSTHRTFEDYCRSRFGYTHRRVNYLIASSLVFDNIMGTKVISRKEFTNGGKMYP
ncbi:hypothetical protein WKK05_39205 (plasmid) [Nostoc sp. UHCC 0302]|uniref:hypothetical protein n=1 Tax=Nostoc sp. UHCC 0302 TaxID=3134896 RepID=UPI00311C946D